MAGRRFLAVLLSFMALLAACGGTSTGKDDDGPDCVVLCEKGKASRCPSSEALNCDDNCFSEDATAETTGCRSTYDGTLRCFADLDDICSVTTRCAAEILAHRGCVSAYCADHDADVCP